MPFTPELNDTFGAVLVGSFISTAQRVVEVRLKIMLMGYRVMDTVNLVLMMHSSYYYLVTHYDQPVILLSGVWSFRVNVSISLTGAISLLTHIFFAHRVYILSRTSRWVSGAIVSALVNRDSSRVDNLLISTLLGNITATTAITFTAGTFANFEKYHWLLVTTTATVAMSEILTTSILCYYLINSNCRFTSKDTLIDKILVYAINAGIVASILAVMSLAMKANLIFLGLYFIRSKMPANSIMAIFNARRTTYVPAQIGSFDLGAKPGNLFGTIRRKALTILGEWRNTENPVPGEYSNEEQHSYTKH
ncbi:uncharacterized protein FOMMEDRAFT_30931 [Fomitiporia mediterranea MF3/22]|uniref:uncharacterized protein n=1 Tax=Fomitiporia mediterranea (strain MF3/22) TaxID=694068 RepID=UPI0004408097|nr:uncharacterized protein FOMMEDRAFT_30931 [Fomitiporia mediterranea MF3/22]EJC99611.1 hypothetical protein FOMMEDRAFT_30931 [Fomitiporia mediterranea MF3/22]